MKARALLLALVLFSGQGLRAQQTEPLPDRWLYYQTNLLVNENIDRLEGIWRRAAAAGYTGVVITDSKFGRLNEMPERYFANCERVKQLAAELKLELIPGVCPIGYSEDLLCQDPNLAEGLPVKEALFEVQSGEARPVADPPVLLRGGDFQDLALWDWKDDTVVAEAGAAKIADPQGQNARIVQQVTVTPFQQYHVSVRVKTQDFVGEPRLAVLAGDQSLCYQNLGVKPTQDWTVQHLTFNSLDNTEVGLYFGCWDGQTGSLWWDDATIEEAPLLNLLRREGAPLTVKRDDTGEALVEGKDFEFVVDPQMGTVPYSGSYEVWHEPPTIKTNLPDGTRLRVSCYHAVLIYTAQVTVCPSELKTVELLAVQFARVHALWHASTYFMMHDEIRVLNWDESCQRRHLSPGAILADNVATCTRLIRGIAPEARIAVWSDMFDPFHNARDDYYLVNGDLAGSWEGLDKDLIIVAWHFDVRDQSLPFFAKRGNPVLIAGYYDAPVDLLRDWLASGRAAGNLQGVMYTTWQARFDDLEAFARIADEEAAQLAPK